MPVEQRWGDDTRQYLIQHYAGRWPVEAFIAFQIKWKALAQGQQIHAIATFDTDARVMGNVMRAASVLEQSLPTAPGRLVLVAPNPQTCLMFDIAQRMAPRALAHVVHAPSMDVALLMIDQRPAPHAGTD